MAYSITRVAENFTSYTASETAIYVYTVSIDGGGTATTGGTAERLFYNSAAAGTTAIFWAESRQTITVSRQNYGMLCKISGFSKKPSVELLVNQSGGTTNVPITYSGLAEKLYLGAVTEYSHQNPSALSYSFSCQDASITTIAHSNPVWSRNAVSFIIPSVDATISVNANSGSSNEPKWKYIFQFKIPYEVSVSVSGEGEASGSGIYYDGYTATLQAQPYAWSSFIGFYDGSTLVSSDETYSFTVSSDISLEARFQTRTISWIDPIVDRNEADIRNKTAKAYINYSDLNRIENDVCYLCHEMYLSYPSLKYLSIKTDWTRNGIPTVGEMERIRSNAQSIMRCIQSTYTIPSFGNQFNYVNANEIENALETAYEEITGGANA